LGNGAFTGPRGAFICKRIPAISGVYEPDEPKSRQFAAGAELHAQVPAEDPPGETARLRHGQADRGPREGAAQDLHIPGGHIHRCHRLSESARKFHFVSRYRYTPTFPFALSLSLSLSLSLCALFSSSPSWSFFFSLSLAPNGSVHLLSGRPSGRLRSSPRLGHAGLVPPFRSPRLSFIPDNRFCRGRTTGARRSACVSRESRFVISCKCAHQCSLRPHV